MARPNYPKVRVANINAMNFSYKGRPWRTGKEPYGPTQFNGKVQLLADGLKRLGLPEVTVWEEIFHSDCLRAVYAEAGYSKVDIFMPDESGYKPCTAIVSSIPFSLRERITAVPKEAFDSAESNGLYSTFRRSLLHMVVKPAGAPEIDIFGGHLKSKLPLFLEGEDPNDVRLLPRAMRRTMWLRAVEAAGTRIILTDTLQRFNRPLVFMADINDGMSSDTAKTLLGAKPFWTLADEQKRGMWDVKLWSIFEEPLSSRPSHLTWTHVYQGGYEALDLLAVSRHLHKLDKGRIGQIKNPKILLDHLRDWSGSVPLSCTDHAMIGFEIVFDNLPAAA